MEQNIKYQYITIGLLISLVVLMWFFSILFTAPAKPGEVPNLLKPYSLNAASTSGATITAEMGLSLTVTIDKATENFNNAILTGNNVLLATTTLRILTNASGSSNATVILLGRDRMQTSTKTLTNDGQSGYIYIDDARSPTNAYWDQESYSGDGNSSNTNLTDRLAFRGARAWNDGGATTTASCITTHTSFSSWWGADDGANKRWAGIPTPSENIMICNAYQSAEYYAVVGYRVDASSTARQGTYTGTVTFTVNNQ